MILYSWVLATRLPNSETERKKKSSLLGIVNGVADPARLFKHARGEWTAKSPMTFRPSAMPPKK